MAKPVLINQTAFIGDGLLGIPLYRGVHRYFPSAPVILLVRKGLKGFFEKLTFVDRVFEIDKSQPEERAKVFRQLKDIEYQAVFSPHESTRSQLLVWGLKANQKIGFDTAWWSRLVYSKTVRRDQSLPDSLRQFSLLRAIDPQLNTAYQNLDTGLTNPSNQNTYDFFDVGIPDWASLDVTSETRVQTTEGFDHLLSKYPSLNQGPVLMAPGSVWETKKWTEEGFVAVATAVSKDRPVAFIGSPAESELCQRLANSVPNAMSIAGETSLFETHLLMRQSSALVANDSGSMHLAASAGLPIVSVFGPTVLPFGYRPWVKNSIVVQQPLECRPCGLHGQKVCPIGTHECMKALSAQPVIQALGTVLSR